MVKDNFEVLLGKRKKEVIKELGAGRNFYPDHVWYYILVKRWWGKKVVLFLEFDEMDILQRHNVKTVYGKVWYSKDSLDWPDDVFTTFFLFMLVKGLVAESQCL